MKGPDFSVELDEPRYEYVDACNAELAEVVPIPGFPGETMTLRWKCRRHPHRFGRHKGPGQHTATASLVNRWRS